MGIRGKTYSYEYDVNGLRTRKTNSDGGYTEYYIMDGLTVAERRFDSTNTEVYVMRYYFDESNAPIGIGIQYPSSADTYWENYYFAKNLQGDIIAIYNSNNGNPNLIATYEYDAWGKPLSIRNASGVEIAPNAYHVGLLNPFRYRGYRYDADTGFYYLQSRYYDPVIGRFINADGLASTGQGFIGYNMFAYCNNNPVMGYDPTGSVNWGGVVAGFAVAAIGIVAAGLIVASAGTATPLLAAGITAAGTALGVATVETGVVTMVGAYTETPVVYDATVTTGNDRTGCSVVYDFGTNTGDVYFHEGRTSQAGYSMTYGTGFVFNYDEPGDYGGEFVDYSISADYKGNNYGIDYCTDPENLLPGGPDKKGSSAFLFTVSAGVSSKSKSVSTSYGYDYYWQVSIF